MGKNGCIFLSKNRIINLVFFNNRIILSNGEESLRERRNGR